MNRISIILVDDHDIVMDGIASLLGEDPQLHVSGKASSVEMAKELISIMHADIVLTDFSLGAGSGLDLTKFIVSDYPGIKVIVLTMHDSVQHIAGMMEAGAKGYLLKNVRQPELLEAIHTVMNGEQYIQRSIAGAYQRCKQQARSNLLSPREIEIIRLIAQEYSTSQISKELFISEHTVETHRKNIHRKTGVKGIVGLMNYAREQGLVS